MERVAIMVVDGGLPLVEAERCGLGLDRQPRLGERTVISGTPLLDGRRLWIPTTPPEASSGTSVEDVVRTLRTHCVRSNGLHTVLA